MRGPKHCVSEGEGQGESVDGVDGVEVVEGDVHLAYA